MLSDDTLQSIIKEWKTGHPDLMRVSTQIRRTKPDRVATIINWRNNIRETIIMLNMGLPTMFGSEHIHGKERSEFSVFYNNEQESTIFTSAAGLIVAYMNKLNYSLPLMVASASGSVRTVEAVSTVLLRMLLLNESPGEAITAPAAYWDVRDGKYYCESDTPRARVLWKFADVPKFNAIKNNLFEKSFTQFNSHIGLRFYSDLSSTSQGKPLLPSKETLLRIDWMLEHIVPRALTSRLTSFFSLCEDNVLFDDRLYNYKLSQKSRLSSHIAKVKLYYRYLSPYNKIERIGSCIYEGEDVIVLLWRLSTLESNIWSYIPSFITKKEPKICTVEGALDIHVLPNGFIYKIINRKITASDREGAKVMADIKANEECMRKQRDEKDLERQLEVIIEDAKRGGTIGLDQLMQHFGTISTLGQFSFPHIEMEAVSVVPVIEDGTVRCRWRIKYISFPRLLSNYRLFFREYRKENVTQRDETALMEGKSTKDRLVEKIAIFRPRPSAATHFMPHKLDSNTGRGSQE
uniref:FACT complex subunit n=1 Tax=Heterorhabditis bacteriophora TaxID=37862 RepID=A0A1I7XUP1_HETBA